MATTRGCEWCFEKGMDGTDGRPEETEGESATGDGGGGRLMNRAEDRIDCG